MVVTIKINIKIKIKLILIIIKINNHIYIYIIPMYIVCTYIIPLNLAKMKKVNCVSHVYIKYLTASIAILKSNYLIF